MLARLSLACNKFDIRVEQGGKPVYVLDLTECLGYLSSVREQLRGGQHDLRSFIDRDILKCHDWARCVRECDVKGDQLVRGGHISRPPSPQRVGRPGRAVG